MIDMTETERAALAAFARQYGHQWKAYLKAAWLSYRHNGINMGGKDSGTLREIRNTRGMRWLEKIRTRDLEPVAIVNGLAGMPTPRLQRMLELLTEQPNGDPGCVTLARRIRAELAARLIRDAESSLGTLSAGQRRDLVADRTSWDRVTIDAAVAVLPD
jgi:hypothetical protein